MSRDISKFEKPEMAEAFVTECNRIGIGVIFTDIDRTYVEQTALFAQGREPLEFVNGLRKKAGLGQITLKENMRKVTWTMNSKHIVNLDDERLDNNKSRALDFAVLKGFNPNEITWDVKADVQGDGIPDYRQAGEIAESLGFKWGGRFKNPDWPHIELA